MESDGLPAPEWLEEITPEPSGQWMVEWRDDETAPHGRILLIQPRHNAQSCRLSFAAMPEREEVAVFVAGGAQPVELDDISAQSTVQLSRSAQSEWSAQLGDNVEGAVRLGIQAQNNRQPPTVRFSSSDSCRAILVLLEGVVSPANLGPRVRVEMAGAELASGEYATLRLVADTLLRGTSNDAHKIERLVVDGDRTLTFGNALGIDHAESAESNATLRFFGNGARQNQPTSVQLASIDSVTISAEPEHRLAVKDLKSAVDAAFEGPMTLETAAGAQIQSIHFRSTDSGAPRLSAAQGSFVLGVTGEFALQSAPNVHIVARGAEGFLLRQVVSQQGRSACPNAFISGFRLPGRLRGRTMLDALADAHHLEPATNQLPGWDYRISGKRGLRWKGRLSRELLQQDAELMRELRRLTHEKGSSGAARTKVGWCAQRLRHATAEGFWENVALSGYRLLGYGERPMPAFLTWFVAAALAAVAMLWSSPLSISWPGGGVFIGEVFSQMLGPLTAITRTGASGDVPDWQFAVRALIAIPMVVGLLSLRNYVRTGE